MILQIIYTKTEPDNKSEDVDTGSTSSSHLVIQLFFLSTRSTFANSALTYPHLAGIPSNSPPEFSSSCYTTIPAVADITSRNCLSISMALSLCVSSMFTRWSLSSTKASSFFTSSCSLDLKSYFGIIQYLV